MRGAGGGVLVGFEGEGETAVLAADGIKWDGSGGRGGVEAQHGVPVEVLLGGEEDVGDGEHLVDAVEDGVGVQRLERELAAPDQSNPLEEEPGPLGLRLTKSPSLIHLIETRLSQENSGTASMALGNKDEKMKASKLAMSLLRIGCWECVSKYENSVMAKFYFARQKLVWEVLDGAHLFMS